MVAIKGRAISRVLENPRPELTAFLVYGPDHGLVSERASILLNHFADDPADPFCVSRLDEAVLAKAPERLIEELNAMAFGAERRTVLIKTTSDAVGRTVSEAITLDRSAVLIVEAGELRPASALRKAFEAVGSAAAIPCYLDDSNALSGVIDEILSHSHQTITPEGRQALIARLGSDRIGSRSEIEKLSAYAGPRCQITSTQVTEATADTGETVLDALCEAVGEGRRDTAEQVLRRAMAGGMSPPALLFAVVRHFSRLHEAAAIIASGKSATSALAGLRPPVHFLRRDGLLRQLSRWTEPELRRALEILASAEVDSRLGPLAAPATLRCLLRLVLLPRRRAA
ncbi:MAG: DNA polymerase III subunit delta [Alphaproteobacteria bacterium]